MSDPTNRTAVENLTVGQHISDNVGVHELVHHLRYRNGDGSPMHALTLRPLGKGEPWVARHAQGVLVILASDEEIREYREQGRRAALAEALHALADDITKHRLPVPAWTFTLRGCLGSRADVEAWVARVGAVERMSGRIPVAELSRPVGDHLKLEVAVQGPPEPEPEPAAEVEAEQDWLFTFGSGQQFDGRFVRIHGTRESARAEMIARFGTAWCDQYDWRAFDAAGLPSRAVELAKAAWPYPGTAAVDDTAPEPQDGHVYSCCGKTGRISPHKSGCPTYKAMLADDTAPAGE
ncbi:hypothetical protein ACFUYE_30875 [Micromonospora humida]|uniref:hypothetical protein n=1 Tax=Micromonospora humida TaxID=2809018 RepID=UPI0036727619